MKIIKIFGILLIVLICNSCNNNELKNYKSQSYYDIDSSKCKKINLMGETCLENYNDSTFYLILNYEAFQDTSLFLVIRNFNNEFILKSNYFDPVENFDLYYYNEDGDSLKMVYTTKIRKLNVETVNNIIRIVNYNDFWKLSYDDVNNETYFDGTWIKLSIALNGNKKQIKRLFLPNDSTSKLFDQILNTLELSNFNSKRYNKN